MTPHRIEKVLALLGQQLPVPARAYLTGAAAGALWGRVRPSLDIDMGLEPRRAGGEQWPAIEAAVERTSRLTGVAISAAADIDRWGMITLLDYRRSSRLFRRLGNLEVRLLDPATWAIGRLIRFLDADVRDVSEVFRRQAVDPLRAARLWGRALRGSPPSTARVQFRRNVEAFLKECGKQAWGAAFDAAAAQRAFNRAAGVPHDR